MERSKLDVYVHPLAIVAACDSYAREQARHQRADAKSGQARDPVLSVLIGSREANFVTIRDSFDICYEYDGTAVKIDQEFWDRKIALLKTVDPDTQVIGWACVTTKIGHARLETIHSTMKDAASIRQLVIMKIDPVTSSDMEELPVKIFDSQFLITAHKLRVEGAEGIAVDAISKVKNITPGGSPIVDQYRSIQNALKRLNMRIGIIQRFLAMTREGTIPKDHDLLRRINSLCNRLPVADSAAFKRDFMTEYNDGLLIAYLAAVTKSTSNLSRVIGKLSMSSSTNSSMISRLSMMYS